MNISLFRGEAGGIKIPKMDSNSDHDGANFRLLGAVILKKFTAPFLTFIDKLSQTFMPIIDKINDH